MSANVINYGRCARTLRKRFVPQCVGALQKLNTTLLNAVWIIHIIWFATVCFILGYAPKIPHRNSERVGPIPRTKRSRPRNNGKKVFPLLFGFWSDIRDILQHDGPSFVALCRSFSLLQYTGTCVIIIVLGKQARHVVRTVRKNHHLGHASLV